MPAPSTITTVREAPILAAPSPGRNMPTCCEAWSCTSRMGLAGQAGSHFLGGKGELKTGSFPLPNPLQSAYFDSMSKSTRNYGRSNSYFCVFMPRVGLAVKYTGNLHRTLTQIFPNTGMGFQSVLCLALFSSIVYYVCHWLISSLSLWDMASYKLMSSWWLRFLISLLSKVHWDNLSLLLNSKVAQSGPQSRWTLHYIIIYHIICNTVMHVICRKRLTLESLILIVVHPNAMKVVQIVAAQGQFGATLCYVNSVETQERGYLNWESGS